MKIYLAGPMRGYENDNKDTFDFATAKLREYGHTVYNPAEEEEGHDIRHYLKADLAWICDHADAVALLPGWEDSSGATTEHDLAIAIGLTVMILGDEFVA